VIAGHVLDAYGAPIVNATVEALRAVYFPTTTNRRLMMAGSARTDDRGQFRLHGLPSGAYYVTALRQTGIPALPIDPRVTGSAGALARTFFPALHACRTRSSSRRLSAPRWQGSTSG
jgi:protocatechuate 3,4-dioxygenase beta subunit